MALLLVSSNHSAHHSNSRSERCELFGSTERLTLGGWVRATLARCCLTLSSSETFTNAILSLSHEYIFARLKNEGWPFLTLDKGHPGSENTQVGSGTLLWTVLRNLLQSSLPHFCLCSFSIGDIYKTHKTCITVMEFHFVSPYSKQLFWLVHTAHHDSNYVMGASY